MSTNPTLYREMQTPVPVEQAEKNANAFLDELAELRVKHHIGELFVVAQVNVVHDEGEGELRVVCHYGDELHAESLAAYGMGFQQAERQKLIAQIASDAFNKEVKIQKRSR